MHASALPTSTSSAQTSLLQQHEEKGKNDTHNNCDWDYICSEIR